MTQSPLARTALLFLVALALSPAHSTAAQDQPNPLVTLIRAQVSDPAQPFSLLVKVTVKEGRNAEFEKAFAKAIKGTRAEQGVLTYDLSRDPKNPQAYIVYERWKSVAAIESHLKSEHIQALVKSLPDLTAAEPVFQVLIPAGE